MKRRFVLLVALLGGIAGCPNMGSMMNEVGSTDSDNDGSSAPNIQESTSLTDAQKSAITSAMQALSGTASSMAAVVPARNAENVISGSIGASACPSLDFTVDTSTIGVAIDFLGGCSPALFPDLTMSGAAEATVFFNVNAIDVLLTELTRGQDTLNGSISGGFSEGADPATFAINVSLLINQDLTVNGGATIEISETPAFVAIADATFVLTQSGESDVSVDVENVIVRASAEEIEPIAGTVTVTVRDETTRAAEFVIVMAFNSDGSATVQLNGVEIGVYAI